ncbi:MAG: DUF4124 domain-containing protein [Proteobacteria bacterium]|nr:DUF4124 domain-containing protein [Pseudomonadota bacterium]
MKRAAVSVFVIMLWVCPCLADENIYTWTDNDGVKRFSDRQPEDVKHYDTIKISPEQSEYKETAGGSRTEYDHMIESIRQEKQQTEQERIQGEADRTAEEKRNVETRKNERIEAERRQLQEKIDDLKKRPTSRAYSQSLKNARIEEIEKQLDKLKNSPDEYLQKR